MTINKPLTAKLVSIKLTLEEYRALATNGQVTSNIDEVDEYLKKKGWILCREDEYLAISVVADLLRSSPNVKETMEQISKVFTVLPEDDDDIVT